MLEFEVPIRAIGKARARSGPSGFYTPQKTKVFEKTVAQYAALAMRNRAKFLGPVSFSVRAKFLPPDSWSRVRQERSQGKPVAVKPDADNIMKAVADALNGIVWRDDSQIACWSGAKLYSDRDSIQIRVEALDG